MNISTMATSVVSFFWSPILAICSATLLLEACSEFVPSQQEARVASSASAPAATLGSASFSEATSGRYALDPDHASLQFSVVHAFLSNYVVRFNKFDVAVILDAANPAASSVTVNVDPTSLDTGYPGDFKAAHANSPFESWDEMLAQSDMFFEAAKYPQIVFRSTQVELVALDKLRVTGDLNLRGQIHPVMLDVTLLGATASHPFSQRPAFGISVTGTIHRSEFGMTSMIGVISDAVTVRFEGELLLPTEAGVPTSP